MRRYVVVLVILALATGGLYQAAEATGSGLLTMFATLGLFLIGAVGTLALNRHQAESGVREVQQALKSLEPECFITDWTSDPGERPDYLVVGPAGLHAVCVDDIPQTAKATKALLRIAQSRDRTVAASSWVRRRLIQAADSIEGLEGIPVSGVLVLSRRRADEADSTADVAVLNPDALRLHVADQERPELLSKPLRIKLTRYFRQ